MNSQSVLDLEGNSLERIILKAVFKVSLLVSECSPSEVSLVLRHPLGK